MNQLPNRIPASRYLVAAYGLCCIFGFAFSALAQEQTPPAQPAPEPKPQERVVSEDLGRYFGTDLIDADWSRHFRIGALVGFNLKADFKTAGNFGVTGSRPGPTGVPGENHFYDDGYVRVDDTGNAQGYTSYWGYENASQYNPATHTLTMHSASSYTTSGKSDNNTDTGIGFDMAYGANPWRWGRAKFGWELGFGLMPLKIEDTQNMPATANRIVHSFNVPSIVMPTAPYNGGSSGIGPTIFDTATALPPEPGLAGTVQSSQTVDVTLYLIRLGPSVHWELSRRWATSLTVAPAVGIVSGDYKFHDTLTVTADNSQSHSKGSFSMSDVVYGAAISGALMFHAEEHGDVYLAFQYMPLGNTESGDGGREARLNMGGGIYVSAGVSWPF